MNNFIVTLGHTLRIMVNMMLIMIRNPGPTLAVATLATGVSAYQVSGGQPWTSAVFDYTALAWLSWIALRWGYHHFLK